MKTTTIQQTPQEVEDEIRGKMVYSRDGILQIGLGNYALDFKKSYAFLGFTKNKTKVILGDIFSFGAQGQDGKREIKYSKKYGRIEYKVHSKADGTQYGEWRIVTDGYRYSERIMEVEI